MRTIWKYKCPFPATDQFMLDMPKGSHVLRVEVQHGEPCLWAMVDSSLPTAPRRFAIVGTGHPAPPSDEAFYLGSFHLLDGNFVGHLFVGWENSATSRTELIDGSFHPTDEDLGIG